MPVLSMRPAEGCHVCRCRIRGVQVGMFRINKNSLRSADRGTLIAVDRECIECRTPTLPVQRWRLDAESTAVVRDHRIRKGWAA